MLFSLEGHLQQFLLFDPGFVEAGHGLDEAVVDNGFSWFLFGGGRRVVLHVFGKSKPFFSMNG